MTTYAEILQAALALPPSQRSGLAAVLRESVDADTATAEATPKLSDAMRAEIARRSAEIDAGNAKFVTWEQVWERAHRLADNHG